MVKMLAYDPCNQGLSSILGKNFPDLKNYRIKYTNEENKISNSLIPHPVLPIVAEIEYLTFYQ